MARKIPKKKAKKPAKKQAKAKKLSSKEIKAKLKSFSAKRGAARRKIHGVVKDMNGEFLKPDKIRGGKLTAYTKEMQEINREEEKFRRKHDMAKDDVERKRASKMAKEALENMSTLKMSYSYWERKDFLNYIFYRKSEGGKFPLKKIKRFIGISVSKDKELIMSWMDDMFNELDSTRVLVIYQQGDEIIDYLVLNHEDEKG